MTKSITIILAMTIVGLAFMLPADSPRNLKCLIQLSNYQGEGAYIIVSILDKNGNYVRSLSVNGKDREWYEDMPSWFNFYYGTRENIDAVTGPSVQNGGRKVAVLQLNEKEYNAGYKLRFESAVEDMPYHEKDVEVELSDQLIGQTVNGTGYIRFVKLLETN